MDSSIVNKIATWVPIGAALAGIGRWIFQLKGDIREAHDRIDELEARHIRMEDKIDFNMKEINRRIDDCKNSVLASVNAIFQVLSKN